MFYVNTQHTDQEKHLWSLIYHVDVLDYVVGNVPGIFFEQF